MKNNSRNFPKKPDPLALKFARKEGTDPNGKKYFYNGDIEKPADPVKIFKLKDKAETLLSTLKELFPTIFSETEPKPLMRGARQFLREYLKEKNIVFSSKDLMSVLKKWTGSMAYRMSLVKSNTRCSFDDKPEEEISKEEKFAALHSLQFFQQQYEWNRYMDTKTKEKAAKLAKKKAYLASNPPKVPKPFNRSR